MNWSGRSNTPSMWLAWSAERSRCREWPSQKSRRNLRSTEILDRCREIARVFATVEEMLRAKNLGTFGHMITGAYHLLKNNPALLEEERRRIRFLLVDEFQDANFAQVEILSLLARRGRRTCSLWAIPIRRSTSFGARRARRSHYLFGIFRREGGGAREEPAFALSHSSLCVRHRE